GDLDPYKYCTVISKEFVTRKTPGYFFFYDIPNSVAPFAPFWKRHAGFLGPLQDEYPAITGPGSATVKYQFVAVATFGDAPPTLSLPDCGPPIADYSFAPATVNEGSPMNFTDRSQAGSAPLVSWLWEFGDGSASTQRDSVHTFPDNGDYTV